MRRWIVCCSAAVILASIGVWAMDPPVVVQPSAAGLSAAEQSLFEGAYQALTSVLWDHERGSQMRLGDDGWEEADFAAFTAGALARLGYATVVVKQESGAAPQVWVLVALDLGTRTMWIPVEPLPDRNRAQKTLGTVATLEPAGGTIILDVSYVSYASIVELPANIAPTARIVLSGAEIVENVAAAWFGNASFDPDGSIVLYQWTFDGDVQGATPNIAQWHEFASGGTHTVGLTVTDNRGAQASTSLALYVLTTEEAKKDSCGCH